MPRRRTWTACAPPMRGRGIDGELAPFFPDVADRLAAAHLVIARAGASTVAELAVAGRPSILVPLPGAIDDHQTANAARAGRRRRRRGHAAARFHPGRAGASARRDCWPIPTRWRSAAAAARTQARARCRGAPGRSRRALMRHRPAEEPRMRALPLSIGTIHFVGIGGIGMSGIAEVLHNARLLACRAATSPTSANVRRLREAGIPVADRPRRRQSRRRAGGRRFDRGEARQSRSRGRARAADPGGAPRRDAGRADAAEMVDRRRRHARQDHHHQPDRRRAGSGAARSDRHQRRHHQRLRHQHAPGRRRLDGGRGRRERRQLPAPAGGDRRRDQHGPRASGPLGHAPRR